MKFSKNAGKILAKAAITCLLALVIFVICYSNYLNHKAGDIELKSRYTFSVCIDSYGNVLDPAVTANAASHVMAQDFGDLGIDKIGDIWISEFIKQYTQKYLSWSKSLKNVKLNDTTILDEEKNVVFISFSAELMNNTSEYFASWDGILDDGRLICEWVVKFDIDNHYDGTATIYVDTMLTPEDYGIYRYNESVKAELDKKEQLAETDNSKLMNYMIKDRSLYVTFDGGAKNIEVPVAYENLLLEEGEGSSEALKYGSYTISTTKTAFVYGGKTVGNEKIPVLLLYTNNKGADWVTCEVAQIYTADYYYVEFFDENVGVIVAGYDKIELQQSSNIYVTVDGGQNWNMVGTGPSTNIIKGVKYIDENVGFFCYDYINGMDSNLYVTRDSGKTFSKVIFEEQKLSTPSGEVVQESTVSSESGASKETAASDKINNSTPAWREVYKEALVPIYDANNVLTVYLTRGADNTYSDSNTAAKYQSSDKGLTWKYIGEFDMTAGVGGQ